MLDIEGHKTVNLALGRLQRFKEMFQVGAFYIQPHVLHLTFTPEGSEAQVHAHQTFEFSIIMRGRINYQVNSQTVCLTEGDTVIIPPRTTHSWNALEDSLILGFMLFFSCQGDSSRQFLQLLKDSIGRNGYQIRRSVALAALGRRIVGAAKVGGSYLEERELCLTREAYTELISLLVPDAGESVSINTSIHLRGESGDRVVDAANYYLIDNIHRMLPPSEVARHVGVGLNHLNRLFKAHRGRTVGQAIAAEKMGRARQMLEGSARSIKDIAASLGFEDTNYFCSFFRKNEGVSASRFRSAKRK